MRHHNHHHTDMAIARLVVSLLALTVLAALTASSAVASRGHLFGQTFGWGVLDGKAELQTCTTACKSGIAGSGKGQFQAPAGLAVSEASEDVYVLDKGNNRVERFSATGAYLGQFDGSGTFEVEGVEKTGQPKPPTGKLLYQPGTSATIAVDNSCAQLKLSEPACKKADPSNGDVYVQDGFAHKVIDKFNQSGEYVGQLVFPEGTKQVVLWGVAVDRGGDLWVAVEEGAFAQRFCKFTNAVANEPAEAKCAEISASGIFLQQGLAVDSEENLYSGISPPGLKEVIAKFGAKGELLNGAIDEEEEATGVASELPSNDVYIDNIKTVARFSPSTPPLEIERFGKEHLTAGSGIGVDSASVDGQVYVADSAANDVVVFPLEPPGPPTVERVSLAEVTATSATFQAEVNPRGATTSYHFEYGPCTTPSACAESPYEKQVPAPPEPEGTVGAPLDFEGQQVGAHPQDLQPGTTYHFRAVAHNDKSGEGVTLGEEKTFTTQLVAPFELPDGRAWELVSPPDKHGARIYPILEGDIQAAAGGSAITYVTDAPTEGEPQGYTNGVQVLSLRRAQQPAGWSSRDIAIPHEQATGLGVGLGNEYRLFSQDLSFGFVQPFGSFNPSLSAEATEQTPYVRSDYVNGNIEEPCAGRCYRPLVTSAPNPFGNEGLCPPAVACGPMFVGASPDGRHVALTSNVGLTTTPGDEGGVYEWSDGSLQLISVLPGGEPATLADGPSLGQSEVVRQAVSGDGTRVVWSAKVAGQTHLYLRDTAKEETVEVDKGLTGEPRFQTATADASKVFFTENGDLYAYDVDSATLTALTSGKAGVQGLIVGASEDGSYVYFVARAKLDSLAVEGGCQLTGLPPANECNLYELHEAGGEWQPPRLVAVLSGEDSPDFSLSLVGLTARVSPNGRYLAFMSQRSLTGYDNRDSHSAKRDEEVFVFDASQPVSGGNPACASCNPTGARPAGVERRQLEGGVAAAAGVWPDSMWLAANIPGWTPDTTSHAFYQSRYLSDSGRLFFNSSDALIPQDANGTEDVYEYEPPGVGGCSPSTPTYSARSGGCVNLISAGASREESGFLDASESGSDVFFLTASRLVKQDFDTALDVYDAHECTTGSPCIPEAAEPPPPCTTEASCKPAPKPQPEIFGAPASATFSGLGNIAPVPPAGPKPLTRARKLASALGACRKRYRRSKHKRGACERYAKKQYAAKATAKSRKRSRR